MRKICVIAGRASPSQLPYSSRDWSYLGDGAGTVAFDLGIRVRGGCRQR